MLTIEQFKNASQIMASTGISLPEKIRPISPLDILDESDDCGEMSQQEKQFEHDLEMGVEGL